MQPKVCSIECCPVHEAMRAVHSAQQSVALLFESCSLTALLLLHVEASFKLVDFLRLYCTSKLQFLALVLSQVGSSQLLLFCHACLQDHMRSPCVAAIYEIFLCVDVGLVAAPLGPQGRSSSVTFCMYSCDNLYVLLPTRVACTTCSYACALNPFKRLHLICTVRCCFVTSHCHRISSPIAG